MTLKEATYSVGETEAIVIKALKKIGGISEKEICRYIPGEAGGYIHHFTLRKMRKTNPQQFCMLIQQYILDPMHPQQVDPRPRARRNKKLYINQIDLKHILELAQQNGDKYLLSTLGAKLSLPRIKKELIRSIRAGKVEEHLWHSYRQALESQAQSLSV